MNYRPAIRFEGHRAAIYALANARQPQQFYAAGSDRMITRWDTLHPEEGVLLAMATSAVYSLRFLSGADLLLAGNAEGHLHIIACEESKEVKLIHVFKSPIFSIQHNLNSPFLAITSGDGYCALLDKNEIKVVDHYPVSSVKLRSCAFHPSGELMALGDASGKIYLLDLSAKKIVQSYQAHHEGFGVNCLLFSEDGSRLYSGGRDAHINISEPENGVLLNSVPAHNYAVYALVYTDPTHEYLASASRDRSLKIWASNDLQFQSRLGATEQSGHAYSVNALLHLDENDWLISAGDDKKIIAWQPDTIASGERIPLQHAP